MLSFCLVLFLKVLRLIRSRAGRPGICWTAFILREAANETGMRAAAAKVAVAIVINFFIRKRGELYLF